jgi:hypothetical protein
MSALIQVIWNDISLEQLQRLIQTMPKRMQAMISARGVALDGSQFAHSLFNASLF